MKKEKKPRKAQGCYRAGVPRPWLYKGGRKAAQKRYIDKDPERRKAQNRASYYRHLEKNQKKRREYYSKNKEKIHSYNRNWITNYRAKLKQETLRAYGDICICCGEKNPHFLTLDHINNDGKEHRKKFPTTMSLQVWLKKNNWPQKIIQILCFNCNIGKNQNGGICPHKTKDL